MFSPTRLGSAHQYSPLWGGLEPGQQKTNREQREAYSLSPLLPHCPAPQAGSGTHCHQLMSPPLHMCSPLLGFVGALGGSLVILMLGLLQCALSVDGDNPRSSFRVLEAQHGTSEPRRLPRSFSQAGNGSPGHLLIWLAKTLGGEGHRCSGTSQGFSTLATEPPRKWSHSEQAP